jgi:hypothetical protein
MAGMIDIQKLFDIPDAATEDRAKGLERVAAMQAPGGMAAYLAPQAQRNASAGFGRMLGVDLRSEKEQIQDQLRQMGTPQTEAEHQAYANLLDKLRTGAGLQYQMARAQEKRAERAIAVDEQNATSSDRQSRASMMQAETTAENEPLLAAAAQTQATAQLIRAQTNDRDNPRAIAAQEAANVIDDFNAQTARRRVELDESSLTTAQIGVVNDAVLAADEARNNAAATMSLANSILAVGDSYTTGGLANIEEAWKDWRGTQNNITALRNQYARLVTQMTLQNLPPGAASDKDIEMARKGFLPENANPEQIAQFLRGYAKLQAAAAIFNEERANYASENKGDLSGFRAKWEETKNSEDIISRIETLSSHKISDEEREVVVSGGGAGAVARTRLGSGTVPDSALNRSLEEASNNTVIDLFNSIYYGGQ